MAMTTIRPAACDDLQSITLIYNEAILSFEATIDAECKRESEQVSWWNDHDPRNPILVYEIDGAVVGWGALSPWARRCSSATTAEVSVYVKKAFRGRGIGRKLLRSLLDEGKRLGHHAILARITTANEVSIRLHESFGFQYAGTVSEVGKKFDQWLDVATYQKLI